MRTGKGKQASNIHGKISFEMKMFLYEYAQDLLYEYLKLYDRERER